MSYSLLKYAGTTTAESTEHISSLQKLIVRRNLRYMLNITLFDNWSVRF